MNTAQSARSGYRYQQHRRQVQKFSIGMSRGWRGCDGPFPSVSGSALSAQRDANVPSPPPTMKQRSSGDRIISRSASPNGSRAYGPLYSSTPFVRNLGIRFMSFHGMGSDPLDTRGRPSRIPVNIGEPGPWTLLLLFCRTDSQISGYYTTFISLTQVIMIKSTISG